MDDILAKRSVVPAVDSRKRTSSRITDGILEPNQKRQKKDWVSKREIQRLKESIQGGAKLSTERLADDESSVFDLWAVTAAPVQESEPALNFLEKLKPKVAPSTLQKAPITMTASGKTVRAVKLPNAGSSYNPSFNDWDDLLTQEGQKEVEAEKKRRQLAEAEAEKAARIAATAAAIDEAAARTDDESAWEGFESGYESPESLKRKRPERKTQAQRNKIKRRRVAERQARHERKMGDKQRHAAELEATTKAGPADKSSKIVVQEEQEHSSDSGDDTKLRRKRLGTIAIPGKRLEVVLPDELQESLRRLKPEGNLMNDRFRNLLVNGKVEARKPVTQPRKARRTYTEKWTYKDFSVPV